MLDLNIFSFYKLVPIPGKIYNTEIYFRYGNIAYSCQQLRNKHENETVTIKIYLSTCYTIV